LGARPTKGCYRPVRSRKLSCWFTGTPSPRSGTSR
jgi:hypothetical protein